MRSVVVLMCCFILLLAGCPASDPASPGGGSGIDGSPMLGDGALDAVDAPLIEMFDLPPDYVDPPLERTGAAEGIFTLAGSKNVTGETSPKQFNQLVSSSYVLQLHLKSTASGGTAEWLTIQVTVPSVTEPLVYQVPVTGAWHYQALYCPSSGTVSIQINNRATLASELNPGAAAIQYYFNAQSMAGPREPNDD